MRHVKLPSTPWPEFNGYNRRQCREAGQYINNINMKTNADYIALIDVTPSDWDAIVNICTNSRMWSEFPVFTPDLQFMGL